MSFFAHLVSSLHDGSKSFIETTRRDIADFSSAIKQETRELLPIAAAHLPLHHQRHHDAPVGADHASDGSSGGEGTAAPDAGDVVPASAAASPSPADSSSGLHFNLERLSGRVLNLLPSVFGGEDENAGTEASGGLSGSDGPAERVASSSSPYPPSPFPQSQASYEQRLQRVMHDRRTYETDPVDAGSSDGQPPAAFLALCQQLIAQHHSSEPEQSGGSGASSSSASSPPLPFTASAIAECLRDPVVHGLYAELVESSQSVSASAFWCRCFYARQRVDEDERKRQKLRLRLAGIRQQQQHSAGDDELAWEEEEDEEGEAREAQRERPPASAQPRAAAEQQDEEEIEEEVRTVATAAEEGADAAAAAAGSGGVCGLSQSPAGSESSGELIDQAEGAEEWTQQSDAADGSRTRPATTAANNAASVQAQRQQQRGQDEDEAADYAEWE